MRGFELPSKGSLARRLGVGLAVGTTLLWLAGTLAAGLFLRNEIDEVFDGALKEVAERVLPLAYIEVLSREAPADAANVPRVPSVGGNREYITYVARDAGGQVLLQSHDADPSEIPGSLEPGFHDTPTLRLYTERAVQGTFLVTAAETRDHRQAAVANALWVLLWPLAAFLPISAFGVRALVGRALRPVVALQGDIETRGRGNLSPVEATALPSEIVPVADAVNRLIARLRRAIQAERSFTANSAHELRTPIAAALAQTQRLLAELPPGPHRDRARAVETTLHRLSRLSEKLMQLAKAEGGGLLSETPHDLAAVLHLVLDEFRRDPEVAKRLVISADSPVWSQIDPDTFAILARNLIENAIKHGSDASPVTVLLTQDGQFAVTNDGPPVPAEVLARLKQPFERGVTEAAGSGLGLAIAEAVAAGIGARLDLLSPVPGRPGGFEARVLMPKVASSS